MHCCLHSPSEKTILRLMPMGTSPVIFFADSASAEGQVHGAGNPPNCFRRLRRRLANRASGGSTRRRFNSPPVRGSSIRLTPPTAFALSNPASCWSGWNHPVLNAPHSIKSKTRDRPIPTSLDQQTVIARSAATKQSSWIATARFEHLAITNVWKLRDVGISEMALARPAQALCDLAGIESSTRPTPNHRLIAANR